jgi:hypothetical protein
MATTSAQVQQLYVAYLGRAADKAGLDYWLSELNAVPAVLTLENLRSNFVNEQPEYTDVYGGLTRTEQVTKIYENLFGRAPDAEGLAYWTTGEGSTVAADQLLVAFINGASPADSTVVNNKVFVAEAYTAAAGADFNADAAAAAIADVDGTTASVTDAINKINDETLPGQVAGLTQIKALVAAEAADVAFDSANKAALDALATKLDVSVDATFDEELVAVSQAADAARAEVSELSTTVLLAQRADAVTALTAARAALSTDEKTLATEYEAAIAAEAKAEAGVASSTEKGAAIGGLDNDAEAQVILDGATATELYDAYVSGTAVQRTEIDTAFKDVDFYATFKAAVVKDAAYADAQAATATAAEALGESDEGATFIGSLETKTAADALVADAQAADAVKASADALVTAHDAIEQAVVDAGDAIDAYNEASANTEIKALVDGAFAETAVKETFFFVEKATAADDFAVASFGSGDSIVLGSGYSFNSGALTTGDNNKAEFFLVDSDNGVQIVLESANFGSSTAVTDATTGVVAPSPADNVAVITLTGVTVADLSVANGIISHVA